MATMAKLVRKCKNIQTNTYLNGDLWKWGYNWIYFGLVNWNIFLLAAEVQCGGSGLLSLWSNYDIINARSLLLMGLCHKAATVSGAAVTFKLPKLDCSNYWMNLIGLSNRSRSWLYFYFSKIPYLNALFFQHFSTVAILWKFVSKNV